MKNVSNETGDRLSDFSYNHLNYWQAYLTSLHFQYSTVNLRALTSYSNVKRDKEERK